MTQPSSASIRVLCVDDEPDFADMAAELLERVGDRLVVETATSASEGLDVLADGGVDCVVSDYDMPGMDGIDFLAAVRDAHPDLPFILFTGEGGEEVASEAISAGVTDYMQKRGGTDQYAVLANRITNSVEQYRAEREAEQTRQRLRDLAESTTDCLWMFDSEWEDLLFISGYEEVWGRPEAAIRANPQDFLKGVHSADRDFVRGAMDRLSDGESIDIEYRIVRGDDDQGWVWVKGEPVFDGAGNVARVVGFTRDVSERKERERQFEALIENTDAAIYIKDREGTYLLANDAFADSFGIATSDIVGSHVSDVFDADSAERSLATDRRVLDSGEPVTEEVVRAVDGEKRTLLSNKFPYRDADGAIVGVMGISRDITERKQRQRDLERYETIVETIPEGVFVIDDEGVVVDMHGPIEDFTGFEPDDLRGTPFERLVDAGVFTERAVEKWTAGVRHLLSSETDDAYVTYEVEATPSPGETRTLAVRLTVLLDGGSFEGTVGVARDVTERKERERELQRRNERLEEFASIVSHDLRSPLNVATGRLDLARAEHDSEHLERLAGALDRMETLIDDLLTLAQDGERVREGDPLDLGSLVERCWENVATAEATLVTDVERTVRADPSRLKQLLENLIRNAVEHGSTSPGSQAHQDAVEHGSTSSYPSASADADGEGVTVTVGALDDGFYVADDGPGIPPDERDRVFETGYSMSDEGTGFGLAIVADIADAHGWGVSLTESEAGGARFEFTGVETVEESRSGARTE